MMRVKSRLLALFGNSRGLFTFSGNAFWLLAGCLTLLLLISAYVLSVRKEEHDEWLWEQTEIAIPNNLDFYYGRERVRREDIAERVRRTRETLGQDRLIHVRASDDVAYGTAVLVVTAVQAAGHERIGLSLLQSELPSDPTYQYYASANVLPLEACVLVEEGEAFQKDSGPAALSRSPDAHSGRARIVVQAWLVDGATSVSLDSKQVSLRDLPVFVRRSLNSAPYADVCFEAPAGIGLGEIMPILTAIKRGGAPFVRLRMLP